MDVSEVKIESEIIQMFSAEQAWRYKAIPNKVVDDTLYLNVDSEFWDSSLSKELSIIFGKNISPTLTAPAIIKKQLSRYYRQQEIQGEQIQVDINKTDRFLLDLIAESKTLGSSDIHIEILENSARVRIRIDGQLVEKYRLPKEQYPALINKIKINANLDISEKRLPQDGRIQFKGHQLKFDIRVSILPTLHGEKVVLRILSNDASTVSIDKLGFSKGQKISYLEGIKKPNGIILISGPTGSGKTTTLYATLKILNEEKRNILTIEDPIEYTLEGINQVQLKESIGLSFAGALRSFLRQDPDVIMVGEIRDKETASIAIRAALTGHLVLSTIHTNSAWETISRLLDMGVPSYLLSGTLNATVAQRLLRILCESCKTKTFLRSENLPLNYNYKKSNEEIYEAKGCTKCHFTGYRGRKAIYEVIRIDKELASIIKERGDASDGFLKDKGVNSLSDSAWKLLMDGETSLEEVYPILLNSQ